MTLINILGLFILLSNTYFVLSRVSLSTCTIDCIDEQPKPYNDDSFGNLQKPGKRGPKGEKGEISELPDIESWKQKILQEIKGELGSWTNPINSCKELLEDNSRGYNNGIYALKDQQGFIYQTYCDMETGGGGWTLVASIHENFMQGHCTTGDRWSSEHGNNASHPHGDGNWENLNVFGHAAAATSDDFKSPGYFSLTANDIMISHVPNDTPLANFNNRSFMRYYTNSSFLSMYGHNLRHLYKNHYPIRDKTFHVNDYGPSVPVIWDIGNNNLMKENTPPSARNAVDYGYIQFRVINYEKGAQALCPGVRVKPNNFNTEHYCVGGTSYFSGHDRSHEYCGDFGAKDWNGYGVGSNWSSNKIMSESVVMIFYK